MTRDEIIEYYTHLLERREKNSQIVDDSFVKDSLTDLFESVIRELKQPQPDSETGLIPCVYCNDADEQANLFEENNYAPYSGMESAININRQQDGQHFVCADLWKDGNVVADFEIFYCPMCGRKLE